LEDDLEVLLDAQSLIFTGNAIDKGRVSLNVQGVFSEDYKSLFIPVISDFEAGDWLQVSGLALRAYDRTFSGRYLGLDLDGDLIPDVSDINAYEVGSTSVSDRTAPYPVTNVSYSQEANGDVTLTWNRPPDYDYHATIINRTRVRNGQSAVASVYDGFSETFTDTNLAGVTAVSYSLVTKDARGNQGEAVILSIDLTEPVVKEPEEEMMDEEALMDVPEDEADELSRLLSYYNVRYSIKCMPSGVAVAENNSACLWARIDLVYAQEMTGQEKVAGLALSDRDLELMATRRQWPEQRYEDNCTMAAQPASYCPALGKALDRISYFLD